MQDNNIREKCRELATRLYELDGEVYESVGSSLGRTFTGDREGTIRNLSALMYTKPDGHLLRSEMALISNMARTIMDKERVALNHMIKRREKISENDHLVICISRTQGSAGNDIGFGLADKLRINYYDVEIFDQVLRRLEAEKGAVNDAEYFADFNKYEKKHKFDPKGWFREFNRYHGLPKQDAVFFNMSDLICDLASKEDCIIMGRCADAILKNNHIPHISLFITAPFAIRVQHVMDVRKMNMKQAVRFLKKMDSQHRRYYNFYGGAQWGKPDNYDLCINSASYGINETENLILKLLNDQIH